VADERSEATNPDDLNAPFLFVRHGDPLPNEWMARHPGWVKFPATMVPRGSRSSGSAPNPMVAQVAGLGAAAAIAPAVVDGLGGLAAASAVELLAGAAAAFAAVGIPLFYAPRSSSETDDMPLYLPLRSGTGVKEGLVPPPPSPPLPGLEPPAESRAKPGEGGFTPTPPTPPLPGFTPAPPQRNVLPGRAAEEQGVTIVHQDRNDGLQGGARTNSPRARKAAKAADPAVTKALQDAEWRAHHLINVAGLRGASDLIAEAARAGWRTDDAGNMAPLPASPEAREKLRAAGIDRPVHNSGHPNWNVEVEETLAQIRADLQKHGLTRGTDGYARAAKEALEKLQIRLRQEMLGRDKLSENNEYATRISS
jgi:hypothetical protein